jgi:streptogramin lyase
MVWFITPNGFSRFNGTAFTTIVFDQSFKGAAIRDIEIAEDGTIWFSSSAGVWRFAPEG